MSTVDVGSGSDPFVLPVSAGDAIASAQTYLALTKIVLDQVRQTGLSVQEYAAIAQAAASAAASSTGLSVSALTTVVEMLPTTQPSSSGQLWLDGGVVVLS